MTILYLISVGESSWSRFGRLEGMRDVSLCEKGRHQMLAVAQQLQTVPLSDIYYARTTRGAQAVKIIHDELCKKEPFMAKIRAEQQVKTGKNIVGNDRGSYFSLSKRNKYAPIKIFREQALNDINYGQLQGLYQEEIEIRHTDIWQQFQTIPMSVTFPQGDSLAQMVTRLQSFLPNLRTNKLFDHHTALITHIPIFKIIQCIIAKTDLNNFHQLKCSDGQISIVQYD